MQTTITETTVSQMTADNMAEYAMKYSAGRVQLPLVRFPTLARMYPKNGVKLRRWWDANGHECRSYVDDGRLVLVPIPPYEA